MHETAADLADLQALLERSYELAGPHLLRILTPERRLTAEWQEFLDSGPVYARIDSDRMFTFQMAAP